MELWSLRDRFQILLLILSKINFIHPGTRKKNYGFSVISGETDVNSLKSMLEAQFGDDPKIEI